MKLKRPSSANDYDTVADMEVDGDPMSPNKAHLVVALPMTPSDANKHINFGAVPQWHAPVGHAVNSRWSHDCWCRVRRQAYQWQEA